MNNRQSGGRRRGRGGQQQRSQGNPGRPDNGNRIDNRARGNAAQLLEKYKTLARDAQMAGDRVNTEYYLQFADHYFRVLSETRARFEEANPNHQQQKPLRGATLEDEDYGDEPEELPVREERAERGDQERGQERGSDRGPDRNGDRSGDRQQEPRQDRREERQPRRERESVAASQNEPGVEGEAVTAGEPADKPRRRRARRDEAPRATEAGEEASGFDAAVLPPSISLPQGLEGEPVEIKPRRRRVRPAGEDVAAAE